MQWAVPGDPEVAAGLDWSGQCLRQRRIIAAQASRCQVGTAVYRQAGQNPGTDLAGNDAVALIKHQPDEQIVKIVAGWARDFTAARARAAGFVADSDFHAIIRAHIADTQS